jgi:amino acid transporter
VKASETSETKTMSVWSVSALGIGSMVGAGIFALLGQVALVAGAETYLAFVLGGVVATLSGYSYAKLAAHYSKAGGISDYFNQAFGTGPLAGALSLVYLLTLVVTLAMVAKTFGAYGVKLISPDSPVWLDAALASAIVIVLTLLNVAGSGAVGKAEILLVALKLSILTVLMLAGVQSMHLAPNHLREHVHPGWFAVLASTGLSFFAYAG